MIEKKLIHQQCNEGRPHCQRCVRYGYECSYSPLRHLRRVSLQEKTEELAYVGSEDIADGSTHHSTDNTEPSTPRNSPVRNLHGEASIYYTHESNTIRPRSPNIRSARHLFELRLIHKFASSAVEMQTHYPNEHHVNTSIRNIYSLAVEPQNWFLMDIVMGCTAASLRAQSLQDESLIEASHTYALRSIQECSKQISQGINASNAEGLFVTSLMIAIHAFTIRQYDYLAEDEYNVTGQLPLLPWLKQFQGVKAVRQVGWQFIKTSPLVRNMLTALPATIVAADQNVTTFFDPLLKGLEDEDVTEETLAAYRLPVAYISKLIRDRNRHGLLGFPVSITERFLALLEGQDPRAMAIIGSYLALISMSRRSSSLVGAAEREFNFIMAHLPAEWLLRLSWAQNVFELSKTTEDYDGFNQEILGPVSLPPVPIIFAPF